MDPREVLQQAEVAAREGRYDEALRQYIWFHDNALQYNRALYGVRLSFALRDWLELAEKYPEALRALEEIRDQKTNTLLEGHGDRELFHDVVAINETLQCEERTYALFRELQISRPVFAEECANLAIAAIVMSKDYTLARRYIPSPELKLKQLSTRFNKEVAELEPSQPHAALRQEARVRNYVEAVSLLVEILQGVGETSEAMRIKEQALELVESPSIRELVRSRL